MSGKITRLSLRRETVRVLNDQNLQVAAGGIASFSIIPLTLSYCPPRTISVCPTLSVCPTITACPTLSACPPQTISYCPVTVPSSVISVIPNKPFNPISPDLAGNSSASLMIG
ncbi:MAG: hypothetical protein HJJLKODD_01198 [Phycisphaerae bacterium]|nr:hypothetical protein [Phycisphaerae bacterium]